MPSTTIRVGPEEPKPTHHLRVVGGGKDIGIILCDGSGRPDPYQISRDRLATMSLKISQGNAKYSDSELPFSPMPQDNWIGGRGNETYEDDVTAFFDSRNMNTMFAGKAFLAGQMGIAKGNRNIQYNIGGSVAWQPLLAGDRHYLAVKFQADANYTADKYSMLLKRVGDPGTCTMRLREDTTGNPGTVLVTKTLTAAQVDDILGIWQYFGSVAQALTLNDYYWLEIYGVATDSDLNHWKVAVDVAPPTSTTKESSDGSSWTGSGIDLYWQIKDADDLPDRAWQFAYRGAEYIMLDYDDAVPVCYIVGDRGAADPNGGNMNQLIDATKSWTVDEHVGKVVKITTGPGSSEAQPWRVITGNDTGYLSISPNWKITHTTDTEYVICGGDKVVKVWAATLCTGDIFDVQVVDDRVYLARGASTNMWRIRAYNNAGAWTELGVADGTNKADRLGVVNHRETGLTKRQIWRGLNDTVQVSRGDVPAWGTDVTFGAGIDVGDKEDLIQNLVEYVDPDYGNKILWVLKKGSIWAIKLDIPDMVQLPEMKNVLSDNNSLVAIVHDTYLYFTLLTGGLERFYSEILDDIGPNRGRGLPAGRLGPISDLMGYPGKFYASVNAGTGFSSILGYDGSWHDKYRADEAGQPILSLGFQVVPGATLDRLWFVEGSTIKWIPFPSETIYPYNDATYPYTHEGVLVLSRMHAGMVDLLKLFDSLSVFADELEEGVCWIEADYKVDSETAVWTPFTNSFYESPSHERNLVSLGDECITGKYLMLRLRLQTSNNLKTPIVRATLVDSVSRIKTKFGYVCQVLFETHPKDLNSRPDDYYEDGLAKIDDFDELADTLTILELSANTRIFDGLRVFCEAPALRPIYQSSSEGKEGFIGTLPITQVLRAEESE